MTAPDLLRTSANPTPQVLVIDDDPLAAVIVRRAVEGLGCRVESALTGEAGLASLSSVPPDLVVLDNILPGMGGVEVLREIRHHFPQLPVLFITARGTGATAIEAMKLAALDYLPKPLDAVKLRAQVERALELQELLSKPGVVEHDASRELSAETLLGECPAMQNVFKAIGKVALQEVPVLIRGEHGTGKETVALAIHQYGDRPEGPFIKFHCPAYDEARMEEELFGSEASPTGRLERAARGVLVLQEVGAMPLTVQSQLLGVLRERTMESTSEKPAVELSCRIISTSSQDLESLVRTGKLRSDLYYLLSSYTVPLPPLRQRHGDLPLLIEHFLVSLSQEFLADQEQQAGTSPRISDDAMRLLCQHTWPGNIDELQSVLKRSLVEAKGAILLSEYLSEILVREPVEVSDAEPRNRHLVTNWEQFADLRIESASEDLYAEAIAETDRKLLSIVLKHTGGNQAQASRILGMTRASLRKKLRALGMSIQQVVETGDRASSSPTLEPPPED